MQELIQKFDNLILNEDTKVEAQELLIKNSSDFLQALTIKILDPQNSQQIFYNEENSKLYHQYIQAMIKILEHIQINYGYDNLSEEQIKIQNLIFDNILFFVQQNHQKFYSDENHVFNLVVLISSLNNQNINQILPIIESIQLDKQKNLKDLTQVHIDFTDKLFDCFDVNDMQKKIYSYFLHFVQNVQDELVISHIMNSIYEKIQQYLGKMQDKHEIIQNQYIQQIQYLQQIFHIGFISVEKEKIQNYFNKFLSQKMLNQCIQVDIQYQQVNQNNHEVPFLESNLCLFKDLGLLVEKNNELLQAQFNVLLEKLVNFKDLNKFIGQIILGTIGGIFKNFEEETFQKNLLILLEMTKKVQQFEFELNIKNIQFLNTLYVILQQIISYSGDQTFYQQILEITEQQFSLVLKIFNENQILEENQNLVQFILDEVLEIFTSFLNYYNHDNQNDQIYEFRQKYLQFIAQLNMENLTEGNLRNVVMIVYDFINIYEVKCLQMMENEMIDKMLQKLRKSEDEETQETLKLMDLEIKQIKFLENPQIKF
ncbi:hypothetical protein PPERSA_07923 [Pseudocohnilembus persalinus]|uniref:Uncharacterized protein n=1 Tax=Pseudocohnilembus persalinus TaxID=266149 RepID=A0A0V0QWZ5_PSEPJ|nr:hypothetical protein PPERSA_07923 [Pseudocohnilembus persalinus]|eukprot:KRX06689.1 hypothetical protein PPERSA_07923 [Pseudocohnilembus persalinus]